MEIYNVGDRIVNNYILPIGEDFLLIDTGGKNTFVKFCERLNKVDIPLEKIKYVFITHIHADHTGFLRELLANTNATLIYNTKGKARLEAGKNDLNVYVNSYLSSFISHITTSIMKKSQFFPSVQTENYIDWAAQPLKKYGIELIELGGHTISDVGLKIGNVLFCGDVFMNGAGSVRHFPAWCENKFQLMKSWEKIIKNTEIITIYPGHGKPFQKVELNDDYKYWIDKGVINLFKKK
jgi:glyoxylase-like metal-dependent hydrolase (beta-lactamase superfamily II)